MLIDFLINIGLLDNSNIPSLMYIIGLTLITMLIDFLINIGLLDNSNIPSLMHGVGLALTTMLISMSVFILGNHNTQSSLQYKAITHNVLLLHEFFGLPTGLIFLFILPFFYGNYFYFIDVLILIAFITGIYILVRVFKSSIKWVENEPDFFERSDKPIILYQNHLKLKFLKQYENYNQKAYMLNGELEINFGSNIYYEQEIIEIFIIDIKHFTDTILDPQPSSEPAIENLNALNYYLNSFHSTLEKRDLLNILYKTKILQTLLELHFKHHKYFSLNFCESETNIVDEHTVHSDILRNFRLSVKKFIEIVLTTRVSLNTFLFTSILIKHIEMVENEEMVPTRNILKNYNFSDKDIQNLTTILKNKKVNKEEAQTLIANFQNKNDRANIPNKSELSDKDIQNLTTILENKKVNKEEAQTLITNFQNNKLNKEMQYIVHFVEDNMEVILVNFQTDDMYSIQRWMVTKANFEKFITESILFWFLNKYAGKMFIKTIRKHTDTELNRMVKILFPEASQYIFPVFLRLYYYIDYHDKREALYKLFENAVEYVANFDIPPKIHVSEVEILNEKDDLRIESYKRHFSMAQEQLNIIENQQATATFDFIFKYFSGRTFLKFKSTDLNDNQKEQLNSVDPENKSKLEKVIHNKILISRFEKMIKLLEQKKFKNFCKDEGGSLIKEYNREDFIHFFEEFIKYLKNQDRK